MKLDSPLATASLRAMYDEIEEGFGSFQKELMAQKGTNPLERASILFEITKAVANAKMRAVAGAVTIQIEERKLAISHGVSGENLEAN